MRKSFNDNELGIKFTFLHSHSAPYSDSRAYYDVELPEGVTVDDAMSVVRGCGVKAKDDDRGWWESYASIMETRICNHGGTWEPKVQLTITHPYLD